MAARSRFRSWKKAEGGIASSICAPGRCQVFARADCGLAAHLHSKGRRHRGGTRSPLCRPAILPAACPSASHRMVSGSPVRCSRAAIRKPDRKDLLLIQLDEGAEVAGVFTQNRFCAAPVTVAREHLSSSDAIRALVVNTGNANAGTGAVGIAHARTTCSELARMLGCQARQILPFSTGVIMESLPLERVRPGREALEDHVGRRLVRGGMGQSPSRPRPAFP